MTAVLVLVFSRRKVPDFRERFWILMKSGLVPTTVALGMKFSPWRELTETARGATEEMLSSFSMAATSLRVKLDFRYWDEEVSSSTMEETTSRVVEGRTTIRSEPIWETWEEIRVEMLPMRERMRMMAATPMAIPEQVIKERGLF